MSSRRASFQQEIEQQLIEEGVTQRIVTGYPAVMWTAGRPGILGRQRLYQGVGTSVNVIPTGATARWMRPGSKAIHFPFRSAALPDQPWRHEAKQKKWRPRANYLRGYAGPLSVSLIPVEHAIPQSEADVHALCDRALRLAPMELLPALPSSEKLLDEPEWYPFEREAWPLGEHIRLGFVKNRKLRTRSAFSKVVEVCLDRTLRRGRQPFVMALEFSQAREFASTLLPLLGEPDVAGQVVGTLLKMKAYGYSNQVQPLLQADKAWIRRLARRYVERCVPDMNLTDQFP